MTLDQRLAELAEEIRPEDLPGDLTARTWDTVTTGRHDRRRRAVLVTLAVAATAAVVAAVGLGSATQRADDPPASGSRLPAHVASATDPPTLSPTAGEVAMLVSAPPASGDDGRDDPVDSAARTAANGGTPLQAVTTDGRLHRIDGDVLPPVDGLSPTGVAQVRATALSPDGTRLAVERELSAEVTPHPENPDALVVPDDGTRIDLHDLVTGEHGVIDLCAQACHVQSMAWSPDSSRLAYQAQIEVVDQPERDEDVIRVVDVRGASAGGTVPPADALRTEQRQLVGWIDDARLALAQPAPVARVRTASHDLGTGASVRLPDISSGTGDDVADLTPETGLVPGPVSIGDVELVDVPEVTVTPFDGSAPRRLRLPVPARISPAWAVPLRMPDDDGTTVYTLVHAGDPLDGAGSDDARSDDARFDGAGQIVARTDGAGGYAELSTIDPEVGSLDAVAIDLAAPPTR